MHQEHLKIENIPAILWGEASEKVYLVVHGKYGSKEEAEGFANVVVPKGWQVLSVDLPEHGERKEEVGRFNPWEIVPELERVMQYMKAHWQHISLSAGSIGAWFSMQAYKDEVFENCLFVSPLVDMLQLITYMMQEAEVTETLLKEKQEIVTDSGEVLSWRYLQYAKQHPIMKWSSDTAVLYGSNDYFTQRDTMEAFCKRLHMQLTVIEKGEHWLHTPKELEILKHWQEENTKLEKLDEID